MAELDDTGVPWIPRLGGRVPLGPELEQIARTGRWDRSRYPGRSEARMAILAAAAGRGWRLDDVRAAAGAWQGLARLYERRSEPGRMDRLLPYEWRKAVDLAGGEKNVRSWHTSDLKPRPPAGLIDGADEYGLIRRWMTAVACAVEDPERVRRWGGHAIAVRLVLLALGQAAMVSGSSVVEFGCRNLALHAALSHRTVARVLELLRNEPDPLIDLVSRRQLARADRYALRIPDRYADSVRWRRRRAGRIDAIHPVFLALGGSAALAYQALDQAEARGAEVARAARLSASATTAALRALAGHGLAERTRRGWRRGGADLDAVAEVTGAADLHRERAQRYRQDREGWRARLRAYQGARQVPTSARDGWWPLDDEDEYDEMCRWPVLSDDFVRGPPAAGPGRPRRKGPARAGNTPARAPGGRDRRGAKPRLIVLILAPVELTRRPAHDLVSVNGHPELQPGVTGMLLRGRPDAGPAGTPVGADEHQIEGLLAVPDPGSGGMLEEDERGPRTCRRARPRSARRTG